MELANYWRSWFIIPIIVAIFFQSWPTHIPQWSLSGKENVLLLTAHPDDEAFFFTPTILNLLAHDVPVFSLCLSTGNADGHGHIRKGELENSLAVLGIPPLNSFILDHPNLQDNFTEPWDAKIISSVIHPHIQKNKFTMILTFDDYGVSGHPNHYSLFHGASYYISSLPPTSPRPRLYSLTSVPLYEKYAGPFLAKLIADESDNISFVSGPRAYFTAAKAITQHRSQIVWYRILYIIFSRYMWINDWKEVVPP